MTGTGITVEGLPEFERTTSTVVRELESLTDSHRVAGDVLVKRPQPRTPAVAADVSYTVEDGVTNVTAAVIYAGYGSADLDSTDEAEIVKAFADEVDHLVSTIHGT